MGGLRARKVVRFGPLRLNFNQRGFTSWSIKVGPWSWNSRARRHRVDLPGPWSWTSGPAGRHRGRYRDGAERQSDDHGGDS